MSDARLVAGRAGRVQRELGRTALTRRIRCGNLLELFEIAGARGRKHRSRGSAGRERNDPAAPVAIPPPEYQLHRVIPEWPAPIPAEFSPLRAVYDVLASRGTEWKKP